MGTFKEWAERKLAERGFAKGSDIRKQIESITGRDLHFVAKQVDRDYAQNADYWTRLDHEKVYLVAGAPFLRYNSLGVLADLYYVGVDNSSCGVASSTANSGLASIAITIDKRGFRELDVSDVEIFDDKNQAAAERSYVVDRDLRRKLCEAALQRVPHFKLPEAVA